MTDGPPPCALTFLAQGTTNLRNRSLIAQTSPRGSLTLLESFPKGPEILLERGIVNALCNLFEGIEQYFGIAQLGERTSHVPDECVLVSVTLLTHRFPKQTQPRSTAFQALARVVNHLVGRDSAVPHGAQGSLDLLLHEASNTLSARFGVTESGHGIVISRAL